MSYQIAYVSIILIGTLLFAMQRSRANVWWVAFYSAAIYTMPVSFNVDKFGNTLHQDAMLMMCFVLVAMLPPAVMSRSRSQVGERAAHPSRIFVTMAVLVALIVFVALPFIYDFGVFQRHKSESGVSGYYYVAWRISASVAVLACVLSGRNRLALVAALPLFGSLLAGDRTAVGLTLIALCWFGFSAGRLTAPRAIIAVLMVGAVALFLFFGKTFQAQWSTGTFVSLQDLAGTVYEDGVQAVVGTEPFVTFGVLNALVKRPLVPPDSVVISAIAQMFPVPSYIGFESTAFNDFFQPRLFPAHVPRSLAYSYWGEGYVRGGWFGFLGFLFFYMIVLRFFEGLTARSHLWLKIIGFLGGAYWAFYVHRNSMASLLAYERQIVLYVVVLAATAFAFRAFNKRIKR